MLGFVKMRQLDVDSSYSLRGHVLERAIEVYQFLITDRNIIFTYIQTWTKDTILYITIFTTLTSWLQHHNFTVTLVNLLKNEFYLISGGQTSWPDTILCEFNLGLYIFTKKGIQTFLNHRMVWCICEFFSRNGA